MTIDEFADLWFTERKEPLFWHYVLNHDVEIRNQDNTGFAIPYDAWVKSYNPDLEENERLKRRNNRKKNRRVVNPA